MLNIYLYENYLARFSSGHTRDVFGLGCIFSWWLKKLAVKFVCGCFIFIVEETLKGTGYINIEENKYSEMTCECSELPRTKGWLRQYLLSKIFGWIGIRAKWRHLVGSWLSFTGKVKLWFALPVYFSPSLSWKHLPQKTGRKKMWMRTECQMALQSDAVRQMLSDAVTVVPNGMREIPGETPSFDHELDGVPSIVSWNHPCPEMCKREEQQAKPQRAVASSV